MAQAQAKYLELAGHPRHNFARFKTDYGKTYEMPDEERERKQVFEDNVKYIIAHNKKYEAGEKSYHLGVNQFADLTHEEFKKIYTVRLSMKAQPNAAKFTSTPGVTFPSEVDWRKQGYVTPVKNQGKVRTCWAFSATGSLEGQHYKAKKELLILSEQQLIDCGDHAADGSGNVDTAFEYIKTCGGIETEENYPYKGQQAKCCFDKSLVNVKVTGYVDIERDSEKQLQEAVATVGPVSVCIDASHESFQFPKGDIYDEPDAGEPELNHAVLCVGYGTEKDGTGEDHEYWLVKNSWSKKWGDEGYIKMSRNKQNQCGIATMASYPLV